MSTYAAVAEPHRRHILDRLRHDDLAAGELAESLALSQPGVSKHLKVLRDAGLVVSRPAGKQRIYSLQAQPLVEVDRWLDPYRAFWSAQFDALARHLEQNP